MLAVADMDVTLQFYIRVLGFDVMMKSAGYSIVARDNATIHFMKAADESVMNAVRGHTEIYIEVVDIAVIWEQAKGFKKDYQIREPFDREYGMREFHIHDPNGCLVFVGQRI
jgi:predicted enzyme related to lactoylglutathione lyase